MTKEDALSEIIDFILKNKVYTKCSDNYKETILNALEVLKREIE